jgi:hypothetical protein
MGPARTVVVDDHQAAAELDHAPGLLEGRPACLLGLLVQQKKEQRPVVARRWDVQPRAVAVNQA